MTQSIYNASLHSLDELPGMEKPKEPSSDTYLPFEYESYNNDILRHKDSLRKYNAHVSSLRKGIPVDESARGIWAHGQKLEEGKDYEVKFEQCADHWTLAESFDCQDCKFMAFPLPVKSEQGEDELWQDLMDYMERYYNDNNTDYSKAIVELSKTYSLTKR